MFLISLALWSLMAPLSAVEFSEVTVAGQRVTVCRVNVRKERLQLFLHDETGKTFKRFDHLEAWLKKREQKVVFAMNAGMYLDDFSAQGLFVSGSRQIAPLNTTNGPGNFFLKPNGVFLLTETGAHVVESSEYPKLRERVILATQSGPLLVQGGRIHPVFKPASTNRLIRNGVGVPSPEIAIFAISAGPINFHEFATLFRDRLDCPDALFLDGVISSLHAPGLKRTDRKADLGPILAVTE